MSVVYLGEHTNNSRYISPERTLQAMLEEWEAGEDKPEHPLVVGLTTSNGQWSVDIRDTNLCGTQILALCETVKAVILRDMGYSTFPEDR